LSTVLLFEFINDIPEASTEETAERETSSSSLSGISQNKTLCQAGNTEFTNVSTFILLFMCSIHFTLYCRVLIVFATSINFVLFMFAEIPTESA
jgi:hypothetical protein